MIWYLYIIRTVDNSLYTGITTNVERRYREHCALGRKSARYFHAHPPEKLLFSKEIGSHSLALKVEYSFKRLQRKEKDAIIRNDILLFNEENGKVLK